MIAYIFPAPLVRLQRGIERLTNPGNWMAPLIGEWRQIITEDNRASLMLGLDIEGKPFIPVKRTKGGPPLLRSEYRAINYATVWGEQTGKDSFTLFIGWPAFRAKNGRNILAMHARPAPGARYPKRDAIGFRPATRRKIVAVGTRYLGRQMRGIMTDAVPGGAGLRGSL